MTVSENGFQHAFKSIDALKPALHEMEILKQHPVSFLSGIEQGLLGDRFLTLTHGNVGELLVEDGDVVFGSNSFDFGSGVDTREEHEEDGDFVGGFREGFEDIEGRLLNIPFSHHFSHEGVQS